MAAIRALAIGAEGSEDGSKEYGTLYRLEGSLVGPGGQLTVRSLAATG